MSKCWPARARRSAALLAAAAFMTCVPTTPAAAQTLDLDKESEPPALGRFTYPNELSGVLEKEIADLLAQEQEAAPLAKVAIRASINVRIIAADLLAEGDGAGRSGSLAVVLGATLAHGRTDLDRTLRRLIDTGVRIREARGRVDDELARRFRDTIGAVRQFNENAVRLADGVRTVDQRQLDRGVPAIIAALGDAVALIERVEIVSHWPAATDVRRPAASGADRTVDPSAAALPATVVDTVDALSRKLGEVALHEPTRRELERILDFLRRGEAFPEHRALVLEYRRLITQVLDLARDVQAATWLDDETRRTYLDRLHLGVVLFKDKRTRDRGHRHLERLETSRRMMDRISLLQSDPRFDVDPIRSAFLAADDMIDNPAEAAAGQAQLRKLRDVCDRMIEYRELEEVKLRRELRSVHRQIDRAYRDAEETLLARLTEFAADPSSMSNPDFSSLVADHRQYLEDLERVRKVPAWLDTVGLIHTRSGQNFYAQTRKMCSWLLDTNRRPDAVRAMEQFEQQLGLFYPLPFEAELRGADPLAVQATGAMHEEYLGTIDDQRREWIMKWGDGDAGSEAANRMLQLYRLNQTMMDSASVFRLGGDATVLNRWAAWELGEGSIARAISELPSRLKLATVAAINGDDDALRRHLDRIDRDVPLAKLLGRLAQALAGALDPLPDGSAATVGQLTCPPPASAWMRQRREALAELCRYALEENHARTTGQMDHADDIAEFVNDRAEALLLELGERRDPLPTLIGFDGSDPRPDVGEEHD